MKYDFAAIEKKWQDKWEQVKPYAAVTGDKRPKFYGLIEFPYPPPRVCTSATRARSRDGHHLPQKAHAGLQMS